MSSMAVVADNSSHTAHFSNGNIDTAPSNSTPVVTSQSEPVVQPAVADVKDESVDANAAAAAAAAGSYGTRSRNRTSRPNYADDNDMDYEFMNVKPSKRQAAAEAALTQQIGNGTSSDALAMSSNMQEANGDSRTISALPLDDQSRLTDGTQPEKKKRKYEKSRAAKPNAEPRQSAAELLPGTSHFSFTPANASDAPPSKKRKTGDHVVASAARAHISAGVVSGQRKGSSGGGHVQKSGPRPSCVVTFERTGAVLQNGKLVADDGTTYAVDDNAYLVCEPPGEPYYLCRIMQFRHVDPDDPRSPVVSMLVNWFYRPKDIQKYNIDPRYLYASMQSDESPITSLRGKCIIRHRAHIEDLDEFRRRRDTFWFNQLYDRYIKRPYELVPVDAVINVPANVKKALNERWKFLAVEQTRLKELTSNVKLCKRCNGYCAPNGSVDCGVCRNTWHMTCVRPALTRKPTRGFAWSCGACSRAQEKKLEARHTAVLPEPGTEEEEEVLEEDPEAPINGLARHESNDATAMQIAPENHPEDALAKLWPWRYLGIHCRVEDVLQFDDRAIYPRAVSRLGLKHEAVVLPWPGQPVEYVKPLEIKRKPAKNGKKDSKLSKEQLATIEADKVERANRPKWVQDEPPGWRSRGEDVDDLGENDTCTLLFAISEEPLPSANGVPTRTREQIVDEYEARIRQLAKEWGLTRSVHPGTPGYMPRAYEPKEIVPTNFLDEALGLLYIYQLNMPRALRALREAHGPVDLGEPDFTKEELKKFEDAVMKHGSDLRTVKKIVKTKPYGDIVRFFYTWKKTERGQQVWGKSEGRSRIRKKAETLWPEIADEEDDSAFDNDKAVSKKRKFQCKFCDTRHSRQWRRAPNVQPGVVVLADSKGSAKDKSNQLVVSLCERCAGLWRKYAMRYEDPEEFAKAIIQAGGRAWKRKIDEETLRECVMANEYAGIVSSPLAAQAAAMIGITVTVLPATDKKRLKDKDSMSASPGPDSLPRKKEILAPPPPPPREPTPPIIPAQPKWRELPCSICTETQVDGDVLCVCTSCKLTVHKRCYGINEQNNTPRWVCETCLNDKNNQASLDYKCVLCPQHDRPMELLEPQKVSHRKKSDRDKEKERLEKLLMDEVTSKYFKSQQDKGRPFYPREAVKKTASNNWMHVVCSVWTPEIRYSEGAKMENAEGLFSAMNNAARAEALCKICRIQHGACVSCLQCSATFHASCAQEDGYIFGFDVTPVKGSRKDQSQIVTLGEERGTMQAAIWCKEHTIKTVVHPINEVVKETGLTALQTYARMFKQADKSLTGTVRKAQYFIGQSAEPVLSTAVPASISRRASLLQTPKARATPPNAQDGTNGTMLEEIPDKHQCTTCDTTTSFFWYSVKPSEDAQQANGDSAESINRPPTWQCHKCHTRDKLGLKDQPEDTEMEDATAIEGPIDFFELTAPKSVPQELNLDTADIDPYTRKLWDCTIWLYRLDGAKHALSGKIFGRLDDSHTHIWMFFKSHTQHSMGFDPVRHAFVDNGTSNGESRVIRDANNLIQAIGDMLVNNRQEAHWRMTEQPIDLSKGPPPNQPTMFAQAHAPALPPMQQPPSQGMPVPRPSMSPFTNTQSTQSPRHPGVSTGPTMMARTPSSASNSTSGHPYLPPVQQHQRPQAMASTPAPSIESAPMQPFQAYSGPPPQQQPQPRPSPYTTFPAAPLSNGNASTTSTFGSNGIAGASTFGNGNVSTNTYASNGNVNFSTSGGAASSGHAGSARASTPREQVGTASRTGASSSPSLKNLVH